MNKLVLSAMVIGLVGSSAFASGFRCSGGDGYQVKLYNETQTETRIPSVMVVSHTEASPATLLVARGSDIRKTNRLNTVRYTVDGSDMRADKVILQINFKEGRETLEEGEEVPGQLIIVERNGDRSVVELDCARYLKGE